ncbi:MAG: hypothetical protein QG566_562, partial [Patescibacteria group bacterium]|nr:hypothetical protein [Patescibacteria group bacterium]
MEKQVKTTEETNKLINWDAKVNNQLLNAVLALETKNEAELFLRD